MKIIDEKKLEKMEIIIKYDLKSYLIDHKNHVIVEYDNDIMINKGFSESIIRGFKYKY